MSTVKKIFTLRYHTAIYITGTSQGLGKALAEVFLQDEGILVIGISRNQNIEQEHYRHIKLDLSNEDSVFSFAFAIPQGVSKVILINNAGIIHPIGLAKALPVDEALLRNYKVNVFAVHAMMLKFVQACPPSVEGQIINISSGAGRYPVPGWSAYCASKSAVDALSAVFSAEHPEWKIWSLAPGIIDTAMQKQIRSVDEGIFPEVHRFIDYHERAELKSPREIAEKIKELVGNPERVKDNIISIRDFL
ncbi:MAG: SDR family NAD(P)-dependent oxidoreductase [Flavobacteriales bacterium]|nr:MAG: SDR family NAD(P)-dependent oxidoreductase [Flavobacteriales bacterium]